MIHTLHLTQDQFNTLRMAISCYRNEIEESPKSYFEPYVKIEALRIIDDIYRKALLLAPECPQLPQQHLAIPASESPTTANPDIITGMMEAMNKACDECVSYPIGREFDEIWASATGKVWQPITEAPKDGTPILAYVPTPWNNDSPSIQVVAQYKAIYGRRERWVCEVYNAYDFEPTHFMPLPPAPTIVEQ